MVIAESERLVLRLMEPGDVEDLKRIWCDKETMQYCGSPVKEERVKEIIEEDRTAYEKYGYAVFGAALKKSGRLIGICGCKPDEKDPRRCELIYHFAKANWGKGYATEAALCLIAWAKRKGVADRLYASAMPQNTSSIKVLQKCGFIQKGFVQFEDTGFVDEPYFEMELADAL